MKKTSYVVITILTVLMTLAILSEIGFRIKDLFDVTRGLKNSMGDINRKYCHAFKPNSRFRLIDGKHGEYNVGVKINNYGFRGRDISPEKKPGTVRIMAIGDSFTFGVGAREDQTIPFLLEKELIRQGKDVEVINAGFGNYSPLLHYLKLRDEYLEFRPDMVIYFFDFSDLSDDWRRERNIVYDKYGKIVRIDPVFLYGKRDLWMTMRAHSKLCVYIHNKVVRLIDKIRILGFKAYIKAKLEGKRAKALIVAKSDARADLNPIEYDGYLMIRGREMLPEIKEHFFRTEKYLTLIRNTLAENGIPMILVIYPYGIHVGPDQWVPGREYWGFEKGRLYDDYYAFSMLEEYAKKNKVPYINVLPNFLKHSDETLFFDIDGHFTPRANELTAEAIASSETFREEFDKIR